MNEGILSLVGNTPLVELTRLFRMHPFTLFAKLEQFNPGGSIKDRPAINVIRHGLETGLIGPRSVVIESSSGNMGIGLAQACAYYKLRFICVVDTKTTKQNIGLLKAYNADIEMIRDPDPVTGEFLAARLNRVKELLRCFEDAFWPNQYASEHNSAAHHRTMEEIARALQGRVDYLFCATSTCGTLRGCVEYVRKHCLRTKVIAVDAVGSVIFGGPKAKRIIPGHGAAIVPPLFHKDLAYDCVKVTDSDCIVGCHRLAREEAFLAGGSSGAVVTAIECYLDKLPPGAVCVAIFPDRGERYLDTIYSPEWIEEHFGEIPSLWKKGDESMLMTAVCS